MSTIFKNVSGLYSTSWQQIQQDFQNEESIDDSLNITEIEEIDSSVNESMFETSDASFFELEESIQSLEITENLWNKNAKQFFKDNSPNTYNKCWSPHIMVQMNVAEHGTLNLKNVTESFCEEKGIARPCTPFKNLNDFKIVKDGIECDNFKFIKRVFAGNLFVDGSTLNLNSMEIAVLPLEIKKHSEIENLTISQNLLKWIPYTITQFSNLQKLNLSHNKIEELPEQLSGLESLQVLDVSYNKLTSLSLKILNQLPDIKKINVSYNEIEELPEMSDEPTKDLAGTAFITDVGRLRDGHNVRINFVGNPLPEDATTHSIGRIKFIVEDKTKKKLLEWLPTLQLSPAERARVLELAELIHGKFKS